jgi:hypothetical protein
MTESEYFEISAREMLVQSNFALADVQASFIAIYLSLIFAYTTVAYVAGKQLSKVQVFIATLVYMTASIYLAANILFMAAGFVEYQLRIEALISNSKELVEAVTLMFWMESLIWPSLMIAPLVFMWSVRREK